MSPPACRHRTARAARLVARMILVGFGFLGTLPARSVEPAPVVVGSKRFTESYVLGEIVRQRLTRAGIRAEHRQGLGNTGVLDRALAAGAVDLYPEYTGTIVREILRRTGDDPAPSPAQLDAWLAPRGLKAGIPLGFNNSYALAMRESQASALGIATVSDLTRPAAAKLALGLSHEFLVRGDGWPALRAAYRLPQATPRGLDHGLAYEAVRDGRVDLIDVYATDAKIGRYGLRVLVDDRGFFPRYDAVLLMRTSVDVRPLAALAGTIDASTMIAMNAAVELDGQSFETVARRFLDGEFAAAGAAMGAAGSGVAGTGGSAAPGAGAGAGASAPIGAIPASAPAGPVRRPSLFDRVFAPDLPRLALQHLGLVFGSLAAAIGVGVPLGIAAWRWPRTAGTLLGAVAVLQTVPSLALLAFLIALVGTIGLVPALIALFLYALLPIVRNTHAGLLGVPAGLAQAAASLGLRPRQALRHVQLPLALPTLLAGVKTAAVINVGTATMAAFIGAGGFGERIVAGLAINDDATMLAGALPAAALALAVQVVFDGIERRLVRGRSR